MEKYTTSLCDIRLRLSEKYGEMISQFGSIFEPPYGIFGIIRNLKVDTHCARLVHTIKTKPIRKDCERVSRFIYYIYDITHCVAPIKLWNPQPVEVHHFSSHHNVLDFCRKSWSSQVIQCVHSIFSISTLEWLHKYLQSCHEGVHSSFWFFATHYHFQGGKSNTFPVNSWITVKQPAFHNTQRFVSQRRV